MNNTNHSSSRHNHNNDSHSNNTPSRSGYSRSSGSRSSISSSSGSRKSSSRSRSSSGLPLPLPSRPRISTYRVITTFTWRALRHPLLPLLLIIGLISAALLLSNKSPSQTEVYHTDIWRPDRDYDEAQRLFKSLKLMDEKRYVEAATMLETISQPPVRLSALMSGVREGSPTIRNELLDLINEWLLSFCATDAPPFPTEKTPLATIILINDIAAYFETIPDQVTNNLETQGLAAMFKRVNIEYKLRQIDLPTQAGGLRYD